ncbi:ClC family H(+)/Cl(-) exchange transporter [Bifidobacterium bombi]|uniref:Cl-channel, voltage-gated family protein n=1 Tax=Bifidobacterium bombi DSM 19703 TaxID=1341695 RepID=A0A086BP58_9BIFI|nr:Cl- channel, voltage-gated family protein [Bifidobacterium bombi DSM 19703]
MAIVGISRRSKWVVAARAVVCGLLVGVLVACYRQGIELATRFAKWMYPQIRRDAWLALPWGLAALVVGLFVAWLVRLEPMASGSGIPQVEGVVRLGLKMRWAMVLVVRFLGGLLCAMFGLSLGQEGPSVQIGAATAQGMARGTRGLILRSGKKFPAPSIEESRPDTSQTDVLITSGAAAGLSAAFSAPLSGVMFALEEVHHSFSPAILLGAAGAALSADAVAKAWFGLTPVLDFTRFSQLTLPQYWWIVPLGLLAGLVGTMMNRLLLGAQTVYAKLPWWSRPVVALAIALPIGLFLPQELGGGATLIKLAEQSAAATGITFLALLFLGKMFFTAVSFGSGAPGGIFMPILTVGTLLGAMYGVLLHGLDVGFSGSGVGAPSMSTEHVVFAWGSFLVRVNSVAGGGLVPASIIPVFAVCAMAGTLTASVQAPLTSILLTVEMSGTLTHMLPVALCSFLALMVSDLLGTTPIYDALLERCVRSGHQGVES